MSMKTRNIYLVFALGIALSMLFTSCEKFLDKGPEENLSIEEAFQERNYVERWLYNLYTGLPMEMDFINVLTYCNPFSGSADELEVLPSYSISNNYFNRGAVNPTIGLPAWGDAAVLSRKCNIFLENIPSTPMSEEDRSQWIGEARFLRAFFNFMALRLYGPIPIYDKILTPGSDFTAIERAPYEECVKFIVDDLDDAVERLPARRASAYYGRATAVAAAALRSRVLLYAASPLYNGNSDYAQMKNAEGQPLIPTTYDASKWRKAADAAKACIDLCEANEYRIHYSENRDPVTSYQEVFYKNWNDEIIYAFNVGIGESWEMCLDPYSLLGAGIHGPTQQMVDSYRMANGEDPFRTDEDGDVIYSEDGVPTVRAESGYDESGFIPAAGPYWPGGVHKMYVNREPRFYASVNFSGQTWKNTTVELWNSGKDGKSSNNAYWSPTGYIQKKMADPESVIQGSTRVLNRRTWVYMRVAEVFLNYAEALNECDPGNADILKYVNEIRKRGGIPELSGSYSQEEMRKLIRQERHIELCFETHRFFDVRRWKIASKTDNAVIYGMNIYKGTYLQDTEFYKRTVVEKRTFTPQMYLFPVPQSEREKIPALVQNWGY